MYKPIEYSLLVFFITSILVLKTELFLSIVKLTFEFSCDKYFWRFFFLFYINNYSKEEVQELLKNNASLYNKIIETCNTEVLEYIENDNLNDYDGGGNRFWVTPFVHFIDLFFESKIPSWIQKDEIIYLDSDTVISINGRTVNRRSRR